MSRMDEGMRLKVEAKRKALEDNKLRKVTLVLKLQFSPTQTCRCIRNSTPCSSAFVRRVVTGRVIDADTQFTG